MFFWLFKHNIIVSITQVEWMGIMAKVGRWGCCATRLVPLQLNPLSPIRRVTQAYLAFCKRYNGWLE